jgi:hypothetical protein
VRFAYGGGMKKQSNRLVGGEPAEALLDIIEGFSLHVDERGHPKADIRIDEDLAPMFWRAYERVELDLIVDRENCSAKHEHAVLDADEWQWFVLDVMAEEICEAVGRQYPPGAPWAILLTDFWHLR